jgi:hypothetical protein
MHKDDVKMYLLAVSMLPVRSAIILVETYCSQSDDKMLKDLLERLPKHLMFYLVVKSFSGIETGIK